MNLYVKTAAITFIALFSILASVVEWRPRRQHMQSNIFQEVYRDARWKRDNQTNLLQDAWKNENENTRRRYQRNVITELESHNKNLLDTPNEKTKVTVNPVLSKEDYLIIFSGKNKHTFTGIKKNHRIKAVMLEGSGSGFGSTESPTDTTTVTFTENATSEGSGNIGTTPTPPMESYTTNVGSKQTEPDTTTVFSTTMLPGQPPACQHGGSYDGNKCICLEHFYGPLCEHVVDRVNIGGKKYNTTVKVKLRVINREFDVEMIDNTTSVYKKFEMNFKSEMKYLYRRFPRYMDVIITYVGPGSVYVEHIIILEAEYKEDESVNENYELVLQEVNGTLEGLKTDTCTSRDIELMICFDVTNITITPLPPKSKEELCRQSLGPGLADHFSPLVTDSVLMCVSMCSPLSKSYLNCNRGTCQLQNNTAARCLCPDTETYLYTSPHCQGKISKTELYGGVGAAIAALLIIIFTVSFFMYKRRKKQKMNIYYSDQDMNSIWDEDNDDEWKVNRGFTNLSEGMKDVTDDTSKHGIYSRKDTFKPILENVDTSFEVKTQRPEISTT